MRKLLFTLLAALSTLAATAQCNVSFTTSVTGLQVTVTNTTSWSLVPGSTPVVTVDWGNGPGTWSALSYVTGSTASYTYTAPGSYMIVVEGIYYDSLNNTQVCYDTSMQLVTLNYPCATTISTINNGGGSYTFTANNIGGGTGLTYLWDFGDGSTGTGASITHTYISSGNYTVSLASSTSGCVDSSFATIQYFNGTLNCNNLFAYFSSTGSGYTRSFNNTSTIVNNIPGITIKRNATAWDFGDGSATVSGNNTSHTYASPGTYTVTLTNDWVDSANTSIVYCTDTSAQQITVMAPPNMISGTIYWDTIITNLQQTTFKVWLIVMDSAQNTLTAVDSTMTSGFAAAYYSFPGYPAGSYRTKAAVVNGTVGALGLLPTYHTSSSYWNTATVINHTGGSSLNTDIIMQSGITTSGPGFIGGSVITGANKSTNLGDPVPNLLIMLRNDANGNLVRFTYTDANGNYSFSNIPAGTYNVYPEDMNYITIPSDPIVLASGQYNASGIDFKHTPTHIKPIPTSISDLPENNLFSIFPNPSNGKVQINWTTDTKVKATVEVVDVTGRNVLKQEAKTDHTAVLNLSSLQPGVYFIKVATEKAQHTERIVLEK
jgi:PKD repeat protein